MTLFWGTDWIDNVFLALRLFLGEYFEEIYYESYLILITCRAMNFGCFMAWDFLNKKCEWTLIMIISDVTTK